MIFKFIVLAYILILLFNLISILIAKNIDSLIIYRNLNFSSFIKWTIDNKNVLCFFIKNKSRLFFLISIILFFVCNFLDFSIVKKIVAVNYLVSIFDLCINS